MAFPTILQIIPELDAGGAERTTLEVSEAIVGAGGRALVASRGGRMEAELQSLGGELVRMDAATKNPIKLLTNANRIADLIRRENVALIHARSRAPAWSAKWAADRTGIPFVTTYHGTYSARTKLKRTYNSIMAQGVRVIANSNYVAELIQSEYGTDPSRITTIPRGVDIERFNRDAVSEDRIAALRTAWRLPADGDQDILLLPGRLTSWKGQSIAIEALSKLNANRRETCQLILAGDAQGRDEYVSALDARISALGLTGQVKRVGHCEDMPAAIALSDGVLAPSTRTEAFGRVAAEALAMACPAIVSDHGGQREIVETGVSGFRVQPGNADDLARAMNTFLSLSKQERHALGASGQAFVLQRYTKTALQSATLNVYKEVLQVPSGETA